MVNNQRDSGTLVIGGIYPSSPVARILLEHRFVRYWGKKILTVYALKVPGGIIYVRSTGSDVAVVKEVFLENVYEKFYQLKQGDVVIDVGANIGAFSVKAGLEVAPTGHIFAVEPATSNFRLLERNIGGNSLTEVCTAIPCAFGSDVSTGTLQIYHRGGDSSLFDRAESEKSSAPVGTEAVRIDTMDNVLLSKLTRLDFLKIDVEGFELEVLKGAKKTLSKFHPKIALETHSFGPSTQEISAFLKAFDYSLELVASGKGLGMAYSK